MCFQGEKNQRQDLDGRNGKAGGQAIGTGQQGYSDRAVPRTAFDYAGKVQRSQIPDGTAENGNRSRGVPPGSLVLLLIFNDPIYGRRFLCG